MGHLMFTLLGCISFGSFLGEPQHAALLGDLLLQMLQLLLCDYTFRQGFVMPTQQCSHLHTMDSSRVLRWKAVRHGIVSQLTWLIQGQVNVQCRAYSITACNSMHISLQV